MKKVGKFLAATLAAVMCVAGFASCKKKNYAENNTEFIIGMSGPLSGAAALYGEAVRYSAEMAIDEINDAGGLNGVKFKLVAYDDGNNADKVATNYADMIKAGAQVSLGCVTTKPALEFKSLSEGDNLFFLTPSASNDDVPKVANGYQMCFADGNQGKAAAEYVKQMVADGKYTASEIGVFYKSDEVYSAGIYDLFRTNVGTDIADSMKVTVFTDNNDSDFSSQIEQLKNCKFIFMPIYYTPASLFMTQAQRAGKIASDAVYYGCDGLDGIDSLPGFDMYSIPQEISMLSHFNSKSTDEKTVEFVTKYTAKHGTATLNQFGASAYDCVYAIYGAMKAALEKDPDSVKVTMSPSELCEVLKAEFNGGYTFSGVTGASIKWDADGYVDKAAVKYVVKESGAKKPE